MILHFRYVRQRMNTTQIKVAKNESQNPKAAWKTVNSLLGKQNKRCNINELVVDDKTVKSQYDP